MSLCLDASVFLIPNSPPFPPSQVSTCLIGEAIFAQAPDRRWQAEPQGQACPHLPPSAYPVFTSAPRHWLCTSAQVRTQVAKSNKDLGLALQICFQASPHPPPPDTSLQLESSHPALAFLAYPLLPSPPLFLSRMFQVGI